MNFRLCVSFPFLLLAAALWGGCLAMFDPTGFGYSEHRLIDGEAFTLAETRQRGENRLYVFTATKPAGKVKVLYVQLFIDKGVKTDGPKLPHEMTPEGQLVVTLKKADIDMFSGFRIDGVYKAPAAAIPGAKSVIAGCMIYFR